MCFSRLAFSSHAYQTWQASRQLQGASTMKIAQRYLHNSPRYGSRKSSSSRSSSINQYKSTKKNAFCSIYQSIPLGLKRVDMKSLRKKFLPRDLVKFRPADSFHFRPVGHVSFLVISPVFEVPIRNRAHLYTVIRRVLHENFVKIHRKLSELQGLKRAFFARPNPS